MTKIKYLDFPISKNFPNSYYDYTIRNNKGIMENQTDYKSVKDGIYVIRGESKNYKKTYHVYDNIWYLMNEQTKDNGSYNADACTYTLYPNISEKEWENLNKIPSSRLSKYWKRALFGYNLHMKCRKIQRNVKLKILQHMNKNK